MEIIRNLIRTFGIGFAISVSCITTYADIDSLPIKEINGKSCHYYLVQPKETVYSITHKLGISKEELLRNNPGAAEGLKAGEILVFPAEENSAVFVPQKDVSSRSGAKPSPALQNNPINESFESAAATHTVQKGETLFGIARKYHLTTNDLIAWNPEATSGLKSGMVLRLTPDENVDRKQDDIEKSNLSTNETYTIKEGETLYKIAKDHNTTVNDILSLNPYLDRNRYSSGQIILLPSPKRSAELPLSNESSDLTMDVLRSGDGAIIRYVVKDGETLYSISRAHGVTVQQLEACNPGITVLKKGMTLIIPDINADNKGSELPIQPVLDNPVDDSSENHFHHNQESFPSVTSTTTQGDGDISISQFDNNAVRIAVTLPFMSASSSRPKSSQLFTEFYKGLLLAVDSLRNNGRPIYLYAFDTQDNLDTLRKILARPELKDMNAIIAPEDEKQMHELAFFGRTYGIPVLNAFVVKDNSYRYNPSVMQCNIPHNEMYTKAIAEMISQLNGAKPVILNSKDGSDDKTEYIKHLRETLDSLRISYDIISYGNRLTSSDLSKLKRDGRYLFIPTSGKLAEFNKIAPSLIEFKDRNSNSDGVRLFGYPEWITFRGESLTNLHRLNSSVFSRFYSVPDDSRTTSFDSFYNRWFGEPTAVFLPNQGMLGFDLGMYLLKSLISSNPQFNNSLSKIEILDNSTVYNGVQNGFHFTRLPHAGSVNNIMYYITFSPTGSVLRKML